MLEQIFHLPHFDIVSIHAILFFVMVIENLIPPFPGDTLLFLGAAQYVTTNSEVLILLITSSLGSLVGFLLVYYLGRFFSYKIKQKGKIGFFSAISLRKTHDWFHKYGYGIILINRFLAATRSVISLFCGIQKLSLVKVSIFAFISSTLWNFILIYSGYQLALEKENIKRFLLMYSNTVTLVLLLVIISFLFLKKLNDFKST